MHTVVPPVDRYTNPIRAQDVPDPDAIALEAGGYALVASSFDRRPGLPLWWSDDLVEWTPVGFAGGWMPLAQPSGGVWAPAIRERAGRLYITWADPDRGIYAVDAPGLTGPWTPPRLILAGQGLIDPCPFWDTDGRVWIVHGWARSRAGFANRLDIFEVDADLANPLGPGRVVIDGDAIDGCTVLEGPKLYRRDDLYWIFAPAGGVETGWQYAFRSRSLAGPWEHRIVLEQGTSATNGPHQGAWVPGTAGEEWFLHFQHTPLHGRILHLQPLAWGDDGWPLIGAAVGGEPAEPVAHWRRPTARPAADRPAEVPAWHGRGADPDDIVLETDAAGRIRLGPTGSLALPLAVDATRIDVMLLEGAGFLAIAGEQMHTVRARGPARLSVEFENDAARFLLDGEPAGKSFTLAAPQWTGIEYAIGAEAEGSALFELSVTVS